MDPNKQPSDSPASSWQDDALEFELTPLEEARRVLDSESMSQFDVVSLGTQEEDQWRRMRRKKLPTDRALSGRAIDWLLGLPEGVRPEHLTARFPRIANALAEVWDDAEERQTAFEKLLNDGRKGRKGFPPDVHAEIVALRDWTIALRDWNEPF